MRRIAAGIAPYFVVFSASACGLIIEIVASRLLAPMVGVSLFTWTSIIGVVLAGISLGNYLGGVLADKYPSPKTLGIILLGAGLTSLAVLPMLALVVWAVRRATYPAAHRAHHIHAIPCPQRHPGNGHARSHQAPAAKPRTDRNVVGKIYALSTAGSIFGVFITGFVLIQWIGTRPILLGVAVFLVLNGNRVRQSVADACRWRRSVGTLRGHRWHGHRRDSLESECQVESNYFCIKVREREIEGRKVRTLTLDRLIHSYVDLDDPTFFVYGYEKIFADISTMVGYSKPQFSALYIGGGATRCLASWNWLIRKPPGGHRN